ncbi:hypothetical protein HMPREF0541_01589 [Lacticaseibacillus rhamnosus ATCC 21052]|nr:hypothetical protein HMPREF0541_01589 [Lacticaseibacillus rhamnosus ATCC 21052]
MVKAYGLQKVLSTAISENFQANLQMSLLSKSLRYTLISCLRT